MPIPFQYLLKLPLLQDLPQESLLRLSTQMSERHFARREMVSSRDQSRFALGFLLEGRLQGVDFTVDGRSVGLYFVEPGDCFGELPVIDGEHAAEHVIAVTKSTAVFLDAAPARQLVFETPSLAQAVMTRLARRVRELTAQRTLLALPNPFQRLCLQLLLLARPVAEGGIAVDPAPTHQELAIMLNSSRETVTRAFQILILHESIRREGARLWLLQPDLLRGIGEGRIEPPKA
jgi:CRP-like cAMP-binding protein